MKRSRSLTISQHIDKNNEIENDTKVIMIIITISINTHPNVNHMSQHIIFNQANETQDRNIREYPETRKNRIFSSIREGMF